MALKKYIFIILISVVTGLFVGWLTGSLLFSLLGAVVMVVINLKDVLVKYLKSEIDIEVEQEIENRKIHTSTLRNTIGLWQEKLQGKELRKYEPAERVGNPNKFWELDTSFIDEIEKDTLIREKDIYYHFSDLEKLWIDFKDLIKEYRLAKKELFNKVKNYVIQQLKNQNFDVGSDILGGFCVSVYREIIVTVKGEINRYEYWIPDTKINCGSGIEKWQLKYCKRGSGNGYIPDTCHDLAEMQERERLKDVETTHKELITRCKQNYLKDIKALIGIERKLMGKSGKLEQLEHRLEIIRLIPLPKSDCGFIKEKYRR